MYFSSRDLYLIYYVYLYLVQYANNLIAKHASYSQFTLYNSLEM